MRATLKILWSGLVNAYDAAFSIVLSNIFFVLLCIPVVTIPLSFAGLFYTNYQLASGESTDWKTFFEGIKRYWWAGIRWTLITAAVLFSLVFYFLMFFDRTEIWASALLGLDLGVMAIWVIMMFLTFPMMLKQEKPGFLMALRNVLVFLMRWPGYSFAFLLPILILAVLSLIFPPLWIFLSIGLIAFLGCYAVYYRIESERHPELFMDPKHDSN
jgi:hypothetical protein